MQTARDLLLSAIEEDRPAVLLLGQDAYCETGTQDPLLKSALMQLGHSPEAAAWTSLFAGTAVQPEFYDWLAERFRRRVLPPWLTPVRQVPWSAVFTSTIDPTTVGLVEDRGREPEVTLSANEVPRAVRSISRPPVYYLFGRAGSPDESSRPPNNRLELRTRRFNHAVPMLGRILDTATSIGVVAVEGVAAGGDWLRIDDILGVLGRAAPNQILWFGELPASGSDERIDFDEAVDAGRVVVEPARLGSVLSELLADGRLTASESLASQETGQITFADGRVLLLSPEERLRVEAVASIVDDAWTAFLVPQGTDTQYDAFRRFHGDVGGPRLLVEGVRRGFSITRDYEQELLVLVQDAIRDHASLDEPIVLHGQSGTGKSIALARVVAKIRQSKAAAVLYSAGRIPQPEQIARFCEDAEKAGAKVTLIVCDANQEVERYRELLLSLRSRGRRVVVVGSRYRISEESDGIGRGRVEASNQLTEAERRAIVDLLNRFGSEDVGATVIVDFHVLALLYRLLPPSRGRIAAGLGEEALVTEQELRARGRKVRRIEPQTLMARRLAEAGLKSPEGIWSDDENPHADDSRDAPGRLIDLVMVTGRMNCHMPVNLLMRAVTDTIPGTDIGLIGEMFRHLDLFRWRWADDEHNELLVYPRLTLEAELICDRRLGSPAREAERLLDIIASVRGSGIDARHEHSFLLDLLDKVGDNSPSGGRYVEAYEQIGRMLTTLRKQHGVVHASLMLQESAFRRAAVRKGQIEENGRLPLLEEARDAIQAALDGIDRGSVRAGKRTRQNLQVERASLYGFLAYDCAKRNMPDGDVWSAYGAARVAIRQAVSVTDNYYPLDVGLWTPADLLEIAELNELQRAEIKADIYSTLDQVDADTLSPRQQEKFQVRQMKLGGVLGNDELTEDAFMKLEALNSTAGFYLKARNLGPSLIRSKLEFDSSDDVRKAEEAEEFLRSNLSKIERDERCLSLFFECQWIATMGRRAFKGQRQPLPHSDDSRRDLLDTLRALNRSAGDSARHVTRYLEAVLAWVSGSEEVARDMFANLGRETEFEDWGRVIRRHRITDGTGSPEAFSGRVIGKRSEGHWRVRVDGLNKVVGLLERDFRGQDVAEGRHMARFGVAFNYIGPIADPIERRR